MTTGAGAFPVLAVTGLRAEARIASGPGVTALSGGGDAARLALLVQASLASGARAVISIGIAGGLMPGLPAGTVIVADRVVSGVSEWATDAAWRRRLCDRLPRARCGTLVGVDEAVASVAGKARLHQRHGALCVDMESHIAARFAARHGVPFAALRIVADPAERALPHAALVGMRSDGSTDVVAVLRALVRRPRDLSALIHTALDARAAFVALAQSRKALGDMMAFGGRPPDSPIGVDDGLWTSFPPEVVSEPLVLAESSERF